MISVVIISKNEADRIGPCIVEASKVSDDILVLDSYSTDQTKEIATQLGARVFDVEWLGYGATKNLGKEYAKYDWILSLDADEYLSQELINEINDLQLQVGRVYSISRLNYYLDRPVYHSGWYPDWVFRLYHKDEAAWSTDLVHEKLIFPSENSIVPLKNNLLHHTYRSKEDHYLKIDKYASLKAQSWIDNKKPPSLIKQMLGPFSKAFKSYVLKLGILDGKAGVEIAKANYHLVKQQLHHYKKLTDKQ